MTDAALTLDLAMDPHDLQVIQDWIAGMERKMSRAELLPIMQAHFEPVAAFERKYLGSHNKSGALSMSLVARSGSGDRTGTLSVFSAPTATRKQVIAKWSNGRSQQQKWAAALAAKGGKGRASVFYGPMVALGHRIVKRNKQGQLYDTGKRAAPVPFPTEAMSALGDQQAELASEAILTHILG